MAQHEHYVGIVGRTALALVTAFSSMALAQDTPYPSRPVRIIVGFTPASSNDILARFIAAKLTERLGQQVIVENRPGANGVIGSDVTAKATPDGHTLMLMSTSHTMNAAIQKSLPFDPLKSFSPVAMIGAGPLVLVAGSALAAGNVRQLIELAKAKPQTVTYASAGTGGINHFAGALFARTANVQMTNVPYKGGAPALSDVVGGQVHVMFGSMPLTLTQIRAGRVKALGVTSAKRSPLLPDVPTVAEAGAPGYEISTWWGMLAPAGVAPPLLAKLNGDISAIVKQPESTQRLEAEGAEPWPMTSAQFARVMAAELDKWARVAREANVRAE